MQIRLRNNGEVMSRELALVSHRGGKGFGPENTVQSLQRALDYGVEMVETDVRMSSDNVPLIHHSPFIGLHLLAHLTASEIGERAPEIPSLRDYLDLAGGRCAMNLEIKRCEASVLAEVIEAAVPAFPILVSSFDIDFLQGFEYPGGAVEIGLLSQYELSGGRLLEQARRCGATTLLPASFTVRNGLVDMAHAEGIKVISWTVNSWEELQESVAAGVDGVITDSYRELRELLESEDVDVKHHAGPAPDNGGGRL